MKSFFKLFALAALVSGLVACGAKSPTAPDPEPTPANLNLTVEVTGAGSPFQGVVVITTGAATREATTDSTSRAFFAGLAAGSYTVGIKDGIPVGYKLKEESKLTLSADASVKLELVKENRVAVCFQQGSGACVRSGDFKASMPFTGIQDITARAEWEIPGGETNRPNFGLQYQLAGTGFTKFVVEDLVAFASHGLHFDLVKYPGGGITLFERASPLYPCTNAGNTNMNEVTCYDEFYVKVEMLMSGITINPPVLATDTVGPYRIVR
jgi:hypothetical protein